MLSLVIIWIFQGGWNIDDYKQYNTQEFFAREDVNRRIDPENFDKELMNAAIFYATNAARIDRKKEVFTFHPILLNAASGHSADMLNFNFFSHINSREKEKQTPMTRIERLGGNFHATAENLARVGMLELEEGENYFLNEEGKKVDKKGNPLKYHTYASLARKVVYGWMHSKDHRKNILGDYSFLGCGVADIRFSKDGFPELIITQNFGKK